MSAPFTTDANAAILPPPMPGWQSALLVLLPLLMLVNCWNKPFLAYDDSKHVQGNRFVTGGLPLLDVFKVPEHSTYFPITLLSYRVDRVIFEQGADPARSWANGIRLMTALYHGATAFLLWRFLLWLGLSGGRALFIALVFAVHPMACETVCWVAERKNALAGMFGFASLLAYIKFASRPVQRIVFSVILFALALMSKPSALGLLPLFLIMEAFQIGSGSLALPAWPKLERYNWRAMVLRVAPLVLLASGCIALNLLGHRKILIPPPGGSVFTALLTDTAIVTRYIYNVLLPFQLSISYFIEPIVSVLDPKLWLWIALLAASAGVSLYFARDRRLVLFGWLWFIGALGPHLNLIALSQLMQDRYVYLAMPGLLLVLTDLLLRLQRPQALRIAGGTYIFLLLLLATVRGGIFSDTLPLFMDAVSVEPRSAHAQYGLALSYARHGDLDGLGRHARLALEAPDAARQVHYPRMALDAGLDAMRHGRNEEAEKFLLESATGPFNTLSPSVKSEALRSIAEIHLQKNPQAAYDAAQKAVAAFEPDQQARLIRARAAIALLAKAQPETIKTLALQARGDLQSIPQSSRLFPQAQKLLQELRLAEAP